VWSWWNPASVHVADWPTRTGVDGDAGAVDPVLDMLRLVRRAKTEAKVSQRAEVARVDVRASADLLPALTAGRADLVEAGSILEFTIATADEFGCDVLLAH
jgi:valyl-tRNA synthetase